MKYSIGQVVFVVLSKKNQVYPMRVVEVITKKTLMGEDISYVLQAGQDGSSTVLLNEIDGEVFNTSEDVKSALTERATLQITRLVDAALLKSKEWYGENLPNITPEVHEEEQSDSDENSSTVVFSDGTIAKVKLPF